MEISKLVENKAGNLESHSTVTLEFTPRIKICGLTRMDEALMCAELGANAIGCVFYPKSPRHLSDGQARDICRALPSSICSVGVFVNEDFAGIMRKVDNCGLKAVQLHGQEPPDLIARLRREGVIVIKAVFLNGIPPIDSAGSSEASVYLVECAGAALPGGNARAWDWSVARGIPEYLPIILAGGLNPGNVSKAIMAASPDAVDVSSGVEAEPGRKDLGKVRCFIDAVRATAISRRVKEVFR